MSNTLAIDIGGTKLALAVFSDGQIIRRAKWTTNRELGPAAALPEMIAIAQGWKKEVGFDRCGVGFGGPVDFANQRVALSTHIAGWDGLPLRDRLQDALGVPTVIDNDANVGALGEAQFGAGVGYRPMFYMTVSTGIGGGLILDDHSIYRGANGWACEIGHMTIRPDGPACLCGSNGCLERMCCGLWLERDYGKPPSELFTDAAFVKRYVVDLALGIKAALMLLNPARVVIGGGISQAGDRLFVPLREELARQWPHWSGARTDVVQAALGGDSVLWGACALAEFIPTS
ncbi:MAG: ROK family protein [Bryobacteraceae bacterium]